VDLTVTQWSKILLFFVGGGGEENKNKKTGKRIKNLKGKVKGGINREEKKMERKGGKGRKKIKKVKTS